MLIPANRAIFGRLGVRYNDRRKVVLFFERDLGMKRRGRIEKKSKKGRYLAAMVLGTALSTFGTAAAAPPDLSCVNDLSRYCTTCWRNARLSPDSWGDCTQEVFCRLLERVPPGAWTRLLANDGEEKREFIRAIDTVKKRGQRARKLGSDSTATLEDLHAQRRIVNREEKAAVAEVASDLLTPRQNHILELCLEGYTVSDVSQKLGLPVERVSDEKYKAVRKLRSYFNAGEN
jgi:RNA polymerase sigma factor (sigma-70 family)